MAEFIIKNMMLFLMSAWFIIAVSDCAVSVYSPVNVARKWCMQMVGYKISFLFRFIKAE